MDIINSMQTTDSIIKTFQEISGAKLSHQQISAYRKLQEQHIQEHYMVFPVHYSNAKKTIETLLIKINIKVLLPWEKFRLEKKLPRGVRILVVEDGYKLINNLP